MSRTPETNVTIKNDKTVKDTNRYHQSFKRDQADLTKSEQKHEEDECSLNMQVEAHTRVITLRVMT